MTDSRTSRRPGAHPRLALAAFVAGAGAVLGVTGCAAGQITQTSTQVAPVPGANADAGEIALRNLVIQYNGPEGYPADSDAPLVVRIFNEGMDPVTLTGVTADKAASVSLVGTPPVVSPTGTASLPPPIESPSPTVDTSPSPAEPPSPTPTATPTTPAPRPVSVVIPARSYVLLVPGGGNTGHLVLTDLAEPIAPGESVTLTFTFDDGTTAVVPVPLAPPVERVPRATPVVEGGHE